MKSFDKACNVIRARERILAKAAKAKATALSRIELTVNGHTVKVVTDQPVDKAWAREIAAHIRRHEVRS